MRQGTSRTLNAEPGVSTERIQNAIDEVASAGGGSVVLASGRHLAGGLRLASGVDLVLQEGAVLAAVDDYAAFAGNVVSVLAEESDRAFILASGVRDAGIFGPGRIDGGSDAWSSGWDDAVGTLVPARHRPRVVVVEDSSNVQLVGFEIVMSPMWTMHLIASQKVSVDSVRIENDQRLPNNDGIVIDGCVDVVVRDCAIRTADDGVCLKTSRRRDGQPTPACRTVRVERCRVSTRSCAFKVGTETHADISDISFVDCRADDANRGIGVFSRDGGVIERISFEHIHLDCRETPVGFWGSGEGITLSALDRRQERLAGAIRDVRITGLSGRTEGAVVFHADRPGLIRNVVVRDVRLTQEEGRLGTAALLDLRPTAADLQVPVGAEGRANSWVRLADGSIAGLMRYPGGMPGLYAHGVEGLSMVELEITRPAPLPPGWNEQTVLIDA